MLKSEPLAPILWSTAALVGASLLHIDRIPLWATAVLAVCAAWQLYAVRRQMPLPPRPLRVALTFILVAGVLALFHTLNGLAAGTVLLVVMGAIKLLETRNRRDRYIVIGAALFLLLAACLDRQALARAPLYIAATLLCCSALAVAAYGGAGLPARAATASPLAACCSLCRSRSFCSCSFHVCPEASGRCPEAMRP